MRPPLVVPRVIARDYLKIVAIIMYWKIEGLLQSLAVEIFRHPGEFGKVGDRRARTTQQTR